MFDNFFKYLFRKVFFYKNRQYLLLISLLAIFLSSFSLLCIQGIMNGLQGTMKDRAKIYSGNFTLYPKNKKGWNLQEVESIKKVLLKKSISSFEFITFDVLLKNNTKIYPVKINGFNPTNKPLFLENLNLSGIILGRDLAYNIGTHLNSKLMFISPVHSNSLMGDRPRVVSDIVSDIIVTNSGNIDEIYSWVRSSLVFNLSRKKNYNKMSLYTQSSITKNDITKLLMDQNISNFNINSWEDENKTLVWSLKLETTVMVSLFSITCLLISVTISSAFNVFLDKIKKDLISFWILGANPNKLRRSLLLFINIIILIFILIGNLFGGVLLYYIHNYGGNILPGVFVDRSLPVRLNTISILFSFLYPYFVSIITTYFSVLSTFKQNSIFGTNKNNNSLLNSLKSHQ
jgi:lipoprotein-releasing system permease protein